MEQERYLRRVLRLLWVGLVLGGLWIGTTWALPLMLPFLLGAGGACLIEPLVRLFRQSFGIPRRWGAMLCTAGLVLLTAGSGALLLWRLCYEAIQLARQLPELLLQLDGIAQGINGWIEGLLTALPPQIQHEAQQIVQAIARQLLALPGWLGGAAAAGAVQWLSGLPEAGLFLFTVVLSLYFLSAGREGLAAAAATLPPGWQQRLAHWRQAIGRAVGSWLRAQGILALACFGWSAAGLLLLGVEPALLLAGLVALADALPVLGSGVVLIPWGGVALLLGQVPLCIGLLLLWGTITLNRSILEPRLVGRQVGLPPLFGLLSMYLGFRLSGLSGLILYPLGAAVAWQLWMGEQATGQLPDAQ